MIAFLILYIDYYGDKPMLHKIFNPKCKRLSRTQFFMYVAFCYPLY